MGIISAAGTGSTETAESLRCGETKLDLLTLFPPGPDGPFPVGQVLHFSVHEKLPRTHRLANMAADMAMAGELPVPDAIVLGGTTGGMPATEEALEKNSQDPTDFTYHGVGTVAEDLARRYGCTGPVVTLSTACASGTTAIAVAAELIRNGSAKSVLTGGADALCQLTYFGFKSLQLLDPAGARPLDRNRRGMSLGEGAAMLLLTDNPDLGSGLQILGTGLSCDAYHPSTPDPQGSGAFAAMQAALTDAGIEPQAVDYINLHGTGTPDNDRAEMKAVNALFEGTPPPLSSTKGITGHTLAAAGAVEAVVAAIGIEQGFIPPNTGVDGVDPDLNVSPVLTATPNPIRTVLSNSFGFGGNNAAVVIGGGAGVGRTPKKQPRQPLIVQAYACLSGVGRTRETLSALKDHRSCKGRLEDAAMCQGLDPRVVRRLKRLSKIALALADEIGDAIEDLSDLQMISMGTGWGALSETSDFLHRLQDTKYRFPSPTDFIGSVHNSAAGQLAMTFNAHGANLTTSGGDYSFEQALLSADVVSSRSADSILILGADEGHPELLPLLDGSVRLDGELADGGGAVLLRRGDPSEGIQMDLACFHSHNHPRAIEAAMEQVCGTGKLNHAFGAIFAGIPAAEQPLAQEQLGQFLDLTGFNGPVIDFRRLTGEFATATALAVTAGIDAVSSNTMGNVASTQAPISLDGKGVLVLGLGKFITAIRILPP
jgi:3-oxoacyl-[acyl-carrier-protein] synthase-1/3-oxoacyl-[acyl-carrier-protein] synthase II